MHSDLKTPHKHKGNHTQQSSGRGVGKIQIDPMSPRVINYETPT